MPSNQCIANQVQMHTLLMPIILLLIITIFGSAVQLSNAEEFGSLRLCPAGGRSFMMAWNLACEMKRKKRSVLYNENSLATPSPVSLIRPTEKTMMEAKRTIPDGYRPATLTEIMKICCDVGCEVRDLLAYCDPFGPWNS